jgi:transcriptional regulator with XRE-family HTH domain
MSLLDLLRRHNLTQRDMAEGTGLAVSAVCDIVNGKRQPTTGTVNRVLAFARRYEPETTYEEVFGDPTDATDDTVLPSNPSA